MHPLPAPAPTIVVEELDDEVCLYRPDNNEVLVLNRTASEIWRLVDGASSAATIADTLADRYAIDQAEIADQVDRVLADLYERGFLVESATSHTAG